MRVLISSNYHTETEQMQQSTIFKINTPLMHTNKKSIRGAVPTTAPEPGLPPSKENTEC